MTKRWANWLVVAAVLAVAALAAIIVATVVDAQNRSRQALRELKQQQIQHLAESLDTRVVSVFSAANGLEADRPYTFVIGDPADTQKLQQVAGAGTGDTGAFLVNRDGRITNGPLLRDPSVIGTAYNRNGFDQVLASGEPAISTVGPGLTTELPTLAFYVPLKTGSTVRGVLVFEVAVKPDSDLSNEAKALGGTDSGDFFVLDSAGTVLASNNDALLNRSFAGTNVFTDSPGLRYVGGEVHAVALVPSVGWRVVFEQRASDFEAGLAQRIQTAILLIIVAGVLIGGLTVVLLLWRLRSARLEQQRMAEINETRERFISIVSHELRTPAAGVLGFLESTLDHWELLDDQARRDAVSRAVANARRLNLLTRDVLDASSAETGELHYSFGPVDVAEEVRSAATAVQELQEERTIEVHAPDEPVWVRADVDRVRQVLMNLLDNAIKSSPVESPIELDVAADGGVARITVTDHGAGLAADELERVFEKFVRGRGRSGGVGLGLYVSRQIVEAHGGRIWADNAPGGGAVFVFTLPVMPA